ncbi:hypothetical protein CEE37_08075 [candidate division LCP-89 bacterium B3_LCP]|uniref:Glycosyltransferase family 9 protein n=1 Tax=candidate division LCP-89 bacterium B3_LCP TaxID=2012998 RepID=A0A532UZ87_UNCL8|nr:MAG: hypothetical protein CEE37_08075 [candidate division LCP-89 bacterium B3_LCP]
MSGVLVISLARIGDIVQNFPAFSDLQRSAGDGGVYAIVQNDLQELAKMSPALDGVIGFDGNALLDTLRDRNGMSLDGLSCLKDIFEQIDQIKPDKVVNLTHTSFSSRFCSFVDTRQLFGRVDDRESGSCLHGFWSRYFFTLLESRSCNGFNLVDVQRDIAAGERGNFHKPNVPEQAVRYARNKLHIFDGRAKIAIAVGANHPLRHWSSGNWKGTIELLISKLGAGIVLLGTDSEAEISSEIARNSGGNCLNLCGQTDPVQLAGVIDECDIFVGNDSGSLHLAASLGKPCVGIYLAMASAWDTAPYSDGAITIEPDLPCHPCSESILCTDPKCHRSITPTAVAETCMNALNISRLDHHDGCIKKIAYFDARGKLNLKGEYKSDDSQRLLWRSLIELIFNPESTDLLTAPRVSAKFYDEFYAVIEPVKNELIELSKQTMNNLENDQHANSDQQMDSIAIQMPVLLSKYPQMRPILDLYMMDCLSGDTAKGLSQPERILAAMDTLLHRFHLIEQHLGNLMKTKSISQINHTLNAHVERAVQMSEVS